MISVAPSIATARLFAQSGDKLEQVDQAVKGSQISGWDVVAAVAVMIGGYFVARLARRFAKSALGKVPNVPEMLVLDVGRIVFWMVILIASGIALSALGATIGWFTIAIVVALVLMVLMIKPTIESMAAGLVLTMRPSFAIGDQIEIDGQRGTVLEIGTRTTQLKTPHGVRIYLVNSQILSKTITVYTAYDSRQAEFEVAVAAGTDVDTATKTITDAVAGVDGVVADDGINVQASAIDANGITLAVQYWYPSSNTSDGSTTDAALRSVNKALRTAGIALATPAVDVNERPGGAPTP